MSAIFVLFNLGGIFLLAFAFGPTEKVSFKECNFNVLKWLSENWKWRIKLKNCAVPLAFDVRRFWIGLLCILLANLLGWFLN